MFDPLLNHCTLPIKLTEAEHVLYGGKVLEFTWSLERNLLLFGPNVQNAAS